MTDVRTTLHLTDTLAAIGRWYPATEDPPRTTASQIRTAPGSKPPIPAAVLSLRRETIDTLTSWALLVAEERDLRPGLVAGDVNGLLTFLSAHAEWLAGHVAGDEAITELGRIAVKLEEIVKQSRPARVRVGACPEDECSGELVALVRQRDSLLPSTVRCDVDRDHAWEPHDWPALGRRLGFPMHSTIGATA